MTANLDKLRYGFWNLLLHMYLYSTSRALHCAYLLFFFFFCFLKKKLIQTSTIIQLWYFDALHNLIVAYIFV